jgi:hypothetical protein
MAAAVGRFCDEFMKIETTLPEAAGFYWWRENKESAWRMVQVVDFGVDDKSQLMTYDVQNHAWSGRSLNAWRAFFPIGEWAQVNEPHEREIVWERRGADGTLEGTVRIPR